MSALPHLPGPGEPPVPTWPGERMPAGGFDLFVRRTPAERGAEPAVYVHGLGGASTNWTDLMFLLAPRLAGTALDLPGFGRSGPAPGRDYSLDAHARAVVAVLRRIGPAHLLGNSLGGAVSTRVAALHPDLVRTLTLVSPALPTLLPNRTTAVLPLTLVGGFERLGVPARPATAEHEVQRVLELCYADPTLVHPERLREAVEELRMRSGAGHAQDAFFRSLRGLLGAYLMRGPRDLWRQAAAVRAPTLLVFGRRDRLVDVRLAPRALRTFAHARLLVLAESGHVAQMETPQAVAEAVLDLLDAARGVGTARPV